MRAAQLHMMLFSAMIGFLKAKSHKERLAYEHLLKQADFGLRLLGL